MTDTSRDHDRVGKGTSVHTDCHTSGEGPLGLSIIVVSWNTRQLLLDLLPSLVRIRNAEVIVVDNASEDGSAEAAELACPEIQMIRCERNLGFAGGVNQGFRAATRPLIVLVNTDTVVLDDAIDKLRAYASEHSEAGIVGPRVLNEDRTLQNSCWQFPSLLNLFLSSTYLYKLFPDSRFLNRERLAERIHEPTAVDAVSGCFFLVRREVVDQVGFLDEDYFMYAEETDYCLRAWNAGFEVHYAPVAEIVHFGGGSSKLVRRRTFLEYRRSMLRFFDKHHGRVAAEQARLLLLLFLFVRLPYWMLRGLLGQDREWAQSQHANYSAGIRFLMEPLAKILQNAPRHDDYKGGWG